MNKNDVLWYQTGFEKLSPLRYHILTLITEMESYNRFAKEMDYPLISESKISDAKKSSNDVEEFFTGRKELLK